MISEQNFDKKKYLQNFESLHEKFKNSEDQTKFINPLHQLLHASDGYKKIPDIGHIRARILSDIGFIYQYRLKDLNAVKKLWEEAFKSYLNEYGKYYYLTGWVCHRQAWVAGPLKEYVAQIEYLNQALSIYQNCYGPRNPNVANILRDLEITYYTLGNLELSTYCGERAWVIEEGQRQKAHLNGVANERAVIMYQYRNVVSTMQQPTQLGQTGSNASHMSGDLLNSTEKKGGSFSIASLLN